MARSACQQELQRHLEAVAPGALVVLGARELPGSAVAGPPTSPTQTTSRTQSAATAAAGTRSVQVQDLIVAQGGKFFGAGVVLHLLKEGAGLRRQRAAGGGETGQFCRPRQQIVWPRRGPRRREIVHRLFSLNAYLGAHALRRHVRVVNCAGGGPWRCRVPASGVFYVGYTGMAWFLFRFDGAPDNADFVTRWSERHSGQVYSGTSMRVGLWTPDILEVMIDDTANRVLLTLIELEATEKRAREHCRVSDGFRPRSPTATGRRGDLRASH